MVLSNRRRLFQKMVGSAQVELAFTETTGLWPDGGKVRPPQSSNTNKRTNALMLGTMQMGSSAQSLYRQGPFITLPCLPCHFQVRVVLCPSREFGLTNSWRIPRTPQIHRPLSPGAGTLVNCLASVQPDTAPDAYIDDRGFMNLHYGQKAHPPQAYNKNLATKARSGTHWVAAHEETRLPEYTTISVWNLFAGDRRVGRFSVLRWTPDVSKMRGISRGRRGWTDIINMRSSCGGFTTERCYVPVSWMNGGVSWTR